MNDAQSGKDGSWGLFITFEGGEGVGKSTQISLLRRVLIERGEKVYATREPGGSPGAEAVRHVLLSGAAEPFGGELEAILFSAARADHVDTVIRPRLAAGIIVLCDRFIDSTRVYQGATGSVPMDLLRRLERIACGDCWPDLTIVLDLSPRIGLERAAARRSGGETPDRFEKEGLALQRKRRRAFLDIAKAEPERCVVVKASAPPGKVHGEILAHVMPLLASRRKGAPNGAAAEATI